MAPRGGFWSYVHKDDQAEGGRISRLARDIVDQFQMITGENISLFLDKDDLGWGDKWKEKIDSRLSTVAFFIPVITPRYFNSAECRHELQFFAQRALAPGIKGLILPLIYVDYPPLHDENNKDELIILMRVFQWAFWTELRFMEVGSEGYRREVFKLATQLVEANKLAEKADLDFTAQIIEKAEENIDDTPGTIDLLANAEEMLERSPGILHEITQCMVQIGEIMNDATDEMNRGNAQGKGFSARLSAARRAANRMSEPVEKIFSYSNEYASNNHGVDIGVRLIIDRAQSEVKDNPDTINNFCEFFGSVRQLSKGSNEAIESIQGMLVASEPLVDMSRDLRPGMRKLKQGLTVLMESAGVSNDWVRLIESTGIECE